MSLSKKKRLAFSLLFKESADEKVFLYGTLPIYLLSIFSLVHLVGCVKLTFNILFKECQ